MHPRKVAEREGFQFSLCAQLSIRLLNLATDSYSFSAPKVAELGGGGSKESSRRGEFRSRAGLGEKGICRKNKNGGEVEPAFLPSEPG